MSSWPSSDLLSRERQENSMMTRSTAQTGGFNPLTLLKHHNIGILGPLLALLDSCVFFTTQFNRSLTS